MTRLLRDSVGSTMAEFALVLPVFLLFVFGLIDGARLMWDMNQLEKATQAGARVAIVTNVLPSDLDDYNYVGKSVGGVTLTQGDPIPLESWVITCTESGCTCTVATCPALGTMNQTDFRRIVDRMRLLQPKLTYANVAVDYRSSGLGFAGDPNGSDISPLVTVRTRDDGQLTDANRLKFRPVTGLSLLTFNLPVVATTLPAEDMNGTKFN